MEFLDFSILNAIVEARKALTIGQLINRLVGYAPANITGAVIRMERDEMIGSQRDKNETIYALTLKGLNAQQNYLYASRDENDAAGIE